MPAVSAAKQHATLQVVATAQDSATRRLHLLMRQREALRPAFRAAWDDLSHHFDLGELEAWAGAVLELAHVNAGPACLMAYWDASRSEQSVVLAWEEHSESIKSTVDTGFGTKLIEIAVKQLHGALSSDWSDGRLRVTLTFPNRDVAEDGADLLGASGPR